MSKKNLLHSGKAELQKIFASIGESAFRADQLYQWIWEKGVFDFSEMSNISQKTRQYLSEHFEIKAPSILHEQKSNDGTIKYLLQLDDGKSIETVWIPRADQDRVTVCISTQVGCRMGCTFCMTAQQKTERNLSAGEIAAQLLVMPDKTKITNVVVMGMGEPFDNYENLMSALDIISDSKGLNIGASHVTVSTSGLVPKIKTFAKQSKCRLAISLNAPNDAIRSQIMPINKAYNVEKLLSAVREICAKEYPRARKSKYYVTFEYILIKDLNNQEKHAHELVRILKGIPCKINLLQYNENAFSPHQRPDEASVLKFQSILRKHGYLNFLRKSRGRDIAAACGQLASIEKQKKDHGEKRVQS